MRFIQHLLTVVGLTLVAATAGASPAAPVSGTDYRTLEKPVATENVGKKVDVVEFFWYDCPHCNAFDPSLEAWIKKQGDKINFKRVPVNFRASFIPQQKLYYALEAMGKVEELHTRIFRAIHVERQKLDTDEQILAYITKQGVDAKKFSDAYNSFGVQTKVQRATQLQAAYQVDGVPLLAIDGKYLTSPSIVSASGGGNRPEQLLFDATLQVADWLVAKSAKK